MIRMKTTQNKNLKDKLKLAIELLEEVAQENKMSETMGTLLIRYESLRKKAQKFLKVI